MKYHIYCPDIRTDDNPRMLPLTVFKCLSDETRLLSTLLISQHQELCVCDLMALLEESQPKISRHLAQLRKCGLLTDRRQEQWVYYSLHPQLPPWVRAIITQAGAASAAQLQQLSRKLATQSKLPNHC